LRVLTVNRSNIAAAQAVMSAQAAEFRNGKTMNRERNAVRRATGAVRNKVRQLRRHRDAKKTVRVGPKKVRKTRGEPRIVDAFGGVDIAVGQGWFSPQGRK
jgi:histidine ammonia-lyase